MKKQILIVEDNIDHIKTITKYLNQYDLLVTTYFNKAQEIAVKEIPDLIITDWDLQSKMGSGIELIENLKSNERTKSIPIILATAFTSADLIEQAYNAGCVDYLRKPYSEQELEFRVKTILSYYSSKNKINVLLLGANPNGSEPLAIIREFNKITDDLVHYGLNKEKFELNIRLNLTKEALLQLMLEQLPNFLHFSGHGEEGSIFLHDEKDEPVQIQNFDEIINLICENKNALECIIINSCKSKSIAANIKNIPTICIEGEISDTRSLEFSSGFYKAIASGLNISMAYRFGLVSANTSNNEIILKNYNYE